jgi:Flp pilus assembly pilin Flp
MAIRMLKQFGRRARAFLGGECGATATEYAVMLALILMGLLGIISQIGSHLPGIYTVIPDYLNT